jgi:hypothetical protein
MANFFVTGTPATRSPYKNTSSSSLSPRLEFHQFVAVLGKKKARLRFFCLRDQGIATGITRR